MTEFTVVIPHLRTPHADRALKVCLERLYATSTLDFALWVWAHQEEPYYAYNLGAELAETRYVLFLSNDHFLAPGWDTALMSLAKPDALITMKLAECPIYPVYQAHTEIDFGRSPETFDVSAWEAWAGKNEDARSAEISWAFPYLVPRAVFLKLGGFKKYPAGSDNWRITDMLFRRSWEDSGLAVERANTWVYHLNGWTSISGAHKARR
jgi:hypothetical protein